MKKKRYLKVTTAVFISISVLVIAAYFYKNYLMSKFVDSVIENNISQIKTNGKEVNASQLNAPIYSNEPKLDSQKEDNANIFSSYGLSIYDSISDNYISLGMKKEEVDKLLGTEESKDFKNLYNYQGLELFYRDNKVAGLVINASKNETGRFKTSKNLGLGSTKADIISIYGESIEKNSNKYLTYFFEKNDNSLVKLKETPKDTEASATKNIYCISYSLFGSGKVSMILIGDYQYAMNMK